MPPTTLDAPRCRMCTRSAKRVRPREGEPYWGAYCGGYVCHNRERLCQNVECGRTFAVTVGTGKHQKYCDEACRPLGGRLHTTTVRCTWCQQERVTPGGNGGRDRLWPYVCAECLDPIKHVVDRLKAHRVPHDRARQLLADPGCEVCDIDIVTPVKIQGYGKTTALLVVDHDHECCPVDSRSCGKCIRGLICRHCNSAAGYVRDDPATARALGDYLARRTAGELLST